MGNVREYRVRDTVAAERVEKAGIVYTVHGPVNANVGDYLVYGSDGTRLSKKAEFEIRYEEVDSEEKAAREFTPAGKTVDEVLKFLRANPDQIDRVKALEEKGTARRGIMEYEKR